MQRKSIALGLFVVITLGLLFWLAANVGALGRSGGPTYVVRLRHAAGLVESNAVKIAGVKVGEIERIDIDHDEAVLTLRVRPDVVLHSDALAIVRAKSLLGEKYLQLDPGSRDAPKLASGAQIERVRNTFEIDEVLNALQPILGGGDDGLTATIGPLAKRVDRLLASAMGDDGTPAILTKEELSATIEDVRSTLAAVRRLVEANELKVGELIDNTNRLLVDVDRLVTDPRVNRTLSNVDRIAANVASDLPGLLKKADKILADLGRVGDGVLSPDKVKTIGKAIDDLGAVAADARKLTGELAKSSKQLGSIFDNLAKILARAAGIDELVIRKFVQKEGIRVNLGVSKETKKTIEQLERED